MDKLVKNSDWQLGSPLEMISIATTNDELAYFAVSMTQIDRF